MGVEVEVVVARAWEGACGGDSQVVQRSLDRGCGVRGRVGGG